MNEFDGDGWRLDDVEALNAQYPDTFHIPPASERRTLAVGDYAKLVFLFCDGDGGGDEPVFQGERMWCKITAVSADGYVGALDNDPTCTDLLACGNTVSFSPKHVANIIRDGSAG